MLSAVPDTTEQPAVATQPAIPVAVVMASPAAPATSASTGGSMTLDKGDKLALVAAVCAPVVFIFTMIVMGADIYGCSVSATPYSSSVSISIGLYAGEFEDPIKAAQAFAAIAFTISFVSLPFAACVVMTGGIADKLEKKMAALALGACYGIIALCSVIVFGNVADQIPLSNRCSYGGSFAFAIINWLFTMGLCGLCVFIFIKSRKSGQEAQQGKSAAQPKESGSV